MAVTGHRISKAATFLPRTDTEGLVGLPTAIQERRPLLQVLALAVKTEVPALLHARQATCLASPWAPAGWKTARGAQEPGDAALGASTWKPANPRAAAGHSGRISTPGPDPELPLPRHTHPPLP